jgi:hypothetical protein
VVTDGQILFPYWGTVRLEGVCERFVGWGFLLVYESPPPGGVLLLVW